MVVMRVNDWMLGRPWINLETRDKIHIRSPGLARLKFSFWERTRLLQKALHFVRARTGTGTDCGAVQPGKMKFCQGAENKYYFYVYKPVTVVFTYYVFPGSTQKTHKFLRKELDLDSTIVTNACKEQNKYRRQKSSHTLEAFYVQAKYCSGFQEVELGIAISPFIYI